MGTHTHCLEVLVNIYFFVIFNHNKYIKRNNLNNVTNNRTHEMVRYRWHLPCCNNGRREKSGIVYDEWETSNFTFYLTNVIWLDQFQMELSTRLRYDLNYRFHHQIFIHIIIQTGILYVYVYVSTCRQKRFEMLC